MVVSLTSRPSRTVLTLATKAPSVHNFAALALAGGRRLPAPARRQSASARTDPDRRNMVLSCGGGAASLHGRTGRDGVALKVHRLPDPTDRGHLATIGRSARHQRPC